MLELGALSVGYPGKRGIVLSEVTARIEPGAFICLLGRNGAGKSTLLRTIAGLQAALSGRVVLGDDGVASLQPATRAKRIAVVLTERLTCPGLTVGDVVALGRAPHTGWAGKLTNDDKSIAVNALDAAGAAAFADRLFDSLSDGERQRVMIARAIAQSPKLMVLDEITAFLDLPGRVEMMTLLRRRARSSGTIVLLSSHDLDLSLQLADVVWLADAEGRLHVGNAEDLIAGGAINAAFDSGDVSFDRALGRFKLVTVKLVNDAGADAR